MSTPSDTVLSSSASQYDSTPQLSRKFVARRTSEGETGRLKEELKCQACGKGYKHVSSLAKHLWEHTPEWSVASKLLISKHQKVQLLEAASILVSMNEEEKEDYTTEGFIKEDDSVTPPEEPKSESPPASPIPIRRGSVAMEVPVTTPRAIAKSSYGRRRMSLSESPAINSLVSVAAAASPLPDSWLKDDDRVPRRRRRSTFVQIPDSIDENLPKREDRGEDDEVFEAEL